MPDLHAARIDALFVYPIKAGGALRVNELEITAEGLIRGDREWAVIDEKNEVTWQGAHPRLARLQPMQAHGALQVAAPGEAAADVPADGPARLVQLWNDSVKEMETFTAFDAGDAVAALLQRVTGSALRLVRFGPDALARRGVNPLHLVSTTSLDELNQHLSVDGLPPAEALRFRPNLVLGAADEPLLPFIEDQLACLHDAAGAWRMPVSTLCVRCVVPGVDPQTGEVSAALPPAVAVLSAERFPGGPSCFGVYATPVPGTRIFAGGRVGLELAF
jgi:uncharacterized protein YcbX